ncbi:pyridoxal phosphate-dependent aminotransferase family protein [Aquirufa ecclesiirivi]|uniref:Pyridoxal phosphate-dependent aminotransferase family protein n=1 Tax=Aquirufa ecclesiirivi TaxID=2715124 RepID=A0ABT4JHE0_9BACT|nr:aminotransferase class I/II-fold pyridoxal phosphate-dependent enzyme [Aquirufa ecclesiirivi]MCZ2475358.1 pyridoxal phosphate-dependent aminotransferase family protein [Aquirufa ecclesiirivi]
MANFMHFADSIPGRIIYLDGKPYRWLGGTNYLGIGEHPLFNEQLKKGIDHFPQNWGSSRKNNIQFSVWDDLEHVLAKKLGHEAAALCSSGFAAGQIALQFLLKQFPQATYSLAPHSHPAITTFLHAPWEGSRQTWIQNGIVEQVKILGTDGIRTPLAELFDFEWAKELHPDQYLLVDESHRIGVQNIQINSSATIIQTASLSKAYGIPAGIILGPKDQIEEIKKDPMWIGSSPPNLAFCFACLNAQDAYEEQREKLLEHINFFQSQLDDTSINWAVGHPSFCTDNENIIQRLEAHGFKMNQFSYPKWNDPAIARASIHATLKKADLLELSQLLHE